MLEEFCKEYCVDRRGTYCLKWDEQEKTLNDSGLMGLWIADMDIKAPKSVLEALNNRVNHGAFGYHAVPDEYYHAFIHWMERRYSYSIQKEWIRFGVGVVSSVYLLLNIYTKKGDAILVNTPAYYPFFEVIEETKRKLVTCNLKNENGYYTMNYEEIEKQIIENQVKIMIQVSPHNPVGRVWKEEELIKLFDLCKKYNVIIISDEIHQDITLLGNQFISAGKVKNGKYSKNIIILNSASKTFNLASLTHSHIVIPDNKLREIFDAKSVETSYTGKNILGQIATQEAYRTGEKWHKNVLELIQYNYLYIKEQLQEKLPNIIISPLEGTYLLWLDLRYYLGENVKGCIQDKCRLAVDYGEWFGKEYKGFIRLNLATDPKNIKEAIKCMIENI